MWYSKVDTGKGCLTLLESCSFFSKASISTRSAWRTPDDCSRVEDGYGKPSGRQLAMLSLRAVPFSLYATCEYLLRGCICFTAKIFILLTSTQCAEGSNKHTNDLWVGPRHECISAACWPSWTCTHMDMQHGQVVCNMDD